MGLGRTTLYSFLSGETKKPRPRVRRIIALWYLDWLQVAPDVDLMRPYVAALEVLMQEMSERQQRETVEIVLDGLESVYVRDGDSPPRWIEMLRLAHRRMAHG